MDHSTHLQIAARIHFALLRHYGEDIAIGALMKNQGDAREALWVCEASEHSELVNLARQFRACSKALGQVDTPPETPTPFLKLSKALRAANTPGFGPTRIGAPDPQPTGPGQRSRMHSPSWAKRSARA
jgi:hypothetical protein